MIVGEFKAWRNLPLFTDHPIWTGVFEWLEKNMGTLENGEYPLPFGDCLVRVMTYDLKSRENARFESHINTIDIQMTITGAEGIEWMPVSNLTPSGDYKPEKDFQFYDTPETVPAKVDNMQGNYCILFPGDGHMPQLSVKGFTFTKKLVVKIPAKAVLNIY
jgi:biofilm protein TabA